VQTLGIATIYNSIIVAEKIKITITYTLQDLREHTNSK
jgi:hypothetical protein